MDLDLLVVVFSGDDRRGGVDGHSPAPIQGVSRSPGAIWGRGCIWALAGGGARQRVEPSAACQTRLHHGISSVWLCALGLGIVVLVQVLASRCSS